MSVHIRIRNGMMPDGEGNGGVSEGDFRGNSTDLFNGGGVVDKEGGHALVHEASSPAMSVVVDKGVVYIPNSTFDVFDSDSIGFWEAVIGGVTAERTLGINSNSSGQTRIDLVCVKIDPGAAPDYFASDVAELIIVEGTPGAGVPNTPAFHEALYQVTVQNGATEITNDDLTDVRVQVTLKDAFVPVTLDNEIELQNKRVTKRIQTMASSATPTPDVSIADQFQLTALAAAAEFQVPEGEPNNGDTLVLRVKDNGTARALSFVTGAGGYRAGTDVPFPTSTIAGKVMYALFKYNSQDDRWDLLDVVENI